MNRTPGDFTDLWPALTDEARQEIEATIATIAHAEHGVCCRRLRELVQQLPSRRERARLLAFLDVLRVLDLLDGLPASH